jgi:hypothetical protein
VGTFPGLATAICRIFSKISAVSCYFYQISWLSSLQGRSAAFHLRFSSSMYSISSDRFFPPASSDMYELSFPILEFFLFPMIRCYAFFVKAYNLMFFLQFILSFVFLPFIRSYVHVFYFNFVRSAVSCVYFHFIRSIVLLSFDWISRFFSSDQ